MTLPEGISIVPASENTVLITWPEKICPMQHQTIINTQHSITAQLHNVIFESIVSYNSLMLYYHFEKLSYQQLMQHIKECLAQADIQKPKKDEIHQQIEIPVYYGEDAGWDLIDVAQQCSLTIEQVIKLHCQQTYHAYALGFTPGFCYLGTLNEQLKLPRKSTPRAAVPKGSVAIAGQQTAIYPNMSPGGWHIIGQTPVEMYQVTQQTFLPKISIGQQIKFKSINKHEFLVLGGEVQQEQTCLGKQL